MKIPLLILYTLFFTVQLFFNLDTPSIPKYGKSAANNISIPSSDIQGISQTQFFGKSTVGSNLRLNKRYEPSGLYLKFTDFTFAPLFFNSSKCEAILTASQYLNRESTVIFLRGPPNNLFT